MSATYKNIQIGAFKKPLPLTTKKRMAILSRHLTRPGERFLDCGCGAGNYLPLLCERLGINAFGIEHEQAVVDSIQSDLFLKARVSQGDLQMLNYADHEWDHAMLNEVLEHVADERKVLCEIRRILKPGGLLFVFSPNRWFPFETHGVNLKLTGSRTYWLPFVPYLPVKLGELFYDSWARNYWQGQMKKLLEDAGFAIVKRDYLWPTFENRSGRQPRFFSILLPTIRFISNAAEKIFFVRKFGVSQVFVCQKILSR
jgi:ubiquinone/menaquinone biosynthesis C-methylase UbiE